MTPDGVAYTSNVPVPSVLSARSNKKSFNVLGASNVSETTGKTSDVPNVNGHIAPSKNVRSNTNVICSCATSLKLSLYVNGGIRNAPAVNPSQLVKVNCTVASADEPKTNGGVDDSQPPIDSPETTSDVCWTALIVDLIGVNIRWTSKFCDKQNSCNFRNDIWNVIWPTPFREIVPLNPEVIGNKSPSSTPSYE